MKPVSSPAPAADANWAVTMPSSGAGSLAVSAVTAVAEVVVSRDGHVASRVAVVNDPGAGSGVSQASVSGERNTAASIALRSTPAADGVPAGSVIVRASSQAEIAPGAAAVDTGGPLRRTLQAIAGSGQGCTIHSFPASTFTVNVAGCFILGLFTQLSLHLKWPPYALAAVGTGFCGGLTTMSSYIVDVLKLAYAGNGATAALYWFSTQAACLLAGWIGWLLGDLASR
jgi:CrcB protein